MKLELSAEKTLLYKKTEDWDFSNPPFDIADFSLALVDTMLAKKGWGLAANQVGYPLRIFAMEGMPEKFICINPRIVHFSEEKVELEEACLSYPGLVFHIERPRHVRLRFYAPNGEVYTKQFTGITARTVQHEICHLDGVPFWSGISRLKFDMVKKKALKKGFDYSNLPLKP